MSRGGKREGAGRPRSSTKKPITIRLENALINELNAKVPSGERTAFIQYSVQIQLNKIVL